MDFLRNFRIVELEFQPFFSHFDKYCCYAKEGLQGPKLRITTMGSAVGAVRKACQVGVFICHPQALGWANGECVRA